MFHCKPPLVPTFLVVICITCHVFATEEEDAMETCKELILLEDIFFEDENDGYQNFIRAFKYLSLLELDKKLGEPSDGEETASESRERGLQYELTRLYFLDLFKHHGIDVSDMDNPYRWCFNFNYNEILSKDVVIKHPYTDCVDFTTKMLKNPDDSENPAQIFESMYENWSLNNLLSELGHANEKFYSEEEKPIIDAKMQSSVRSYTMEYFNYYLKVLDNQDIDPNNFRSIQRYCEEEGYLTVMDLG